jgi:aminoglycoside phosphotransferase (APT) family kinase protein
VTSAELPLHTASSPVASAVGADLRGWSALPLLGHVTGRGEPWLFLTGDMDAWVGVGALSDAQFVRLTLRHDRWPFRDGVFGGIVIDGEAVAQQLATSDALQRVLSEASRTNARQGNVLIVCSHRLVPRRLHAWKDYGRRSVARWRRAAVAIRQHAPAAGFVMLDGERLTDVTVTCADRSQLRERRAQADRVVLRVAASPRTDAGIVRAMVADAARAAGTALTIDRIGVRKIGKTAVFLSAADGRRYIMRVARSPIALARGERNYTALLKLHGASLPGDVRRLIPVAAGLGSHAGFHYFLETRLDGASGPPTARTGAVNNWCEEVVRVITTLHRATATQVSFGADELKRFVHAPVDLVSRACTSPAHTATLLRVATACERALSGRTLPLVQTHGDLTAPNCLFDASGALSAIVDWEVSSAQGLPFLDLLQLLPLEGESSSHPRWQRFDYWLESWRNPDLVLSDRHVRGYLDQLGVDEAVIPALLLVQWLTHVADRVDARRDDARWMRMRVWQPLESMGTVL